MSDENTEEYMTFEEQVMDSVLERMTDAIRTGELYLEDTINETMYEHDIVAKDLTILLGKVVLTRNGQCQRRSAQRADHVMHAKLRVNALLKRKMSMSTSGYNKNCSTSATKSWS